MSAPLCRVTAEVPSCGRLSYPRMLAPASPRWWEGWWASGRMNVAAWGSIPGFPRTSTGSLASWRHNCCRRRPRCDHIHVAQVEDVKSEVWKILKIIHSLILYAFIFASFYFMSQFCLFHDAGRSHSCFISLRCWEYSLENTRMNKLVVFILCHFLSCHMQSCFMNLCP